MSFDKETIRKILTSPAQKFSTTPWVVRKSWHVALKKFLVPTMFQSPVRWSKSPLLYTSTDMPIIYGRSNYNDMCAYLYIVSEYHCWLYDATWWQYAYINNRSSTFLIYWWTDRDQSRQRRCSHRWFACVSNSCCLCVWLASFSLSKIRAHLQYRAAPRAVRLSILLLFALFVCQT